MVREGLTTLLPLIAFKAEPIAVGKFLVPDWGDIVDSAWHRVVLPAGFWWRAGTTNLSHSRPYPPVKD
jgi:hypothetical protein